MPDDLSSFYVLYYSTAVTGEQVRHISRPFASARDARHYMKSLPTSREPRILQPWSPHA
jgi:hypothetical protein